MNPDPIVIASAARTPMGAFQGELKGFTAPELGAAAIRAVVERAKLTPEDVQEVLMGCVLPAGLGQAPARQAALGAGIPVGTSCTTLNKVCGSGMKAVMMGCDAIIAGTSTVVVAGGMESMTNAPYLLTRARGGYRMGHDKVYDHMFLDALEDAYEGVAMGNYGELCADKYAFSREEQDAFALESLARATQAIEQGRFKNEIVPMTVKIGRADTVVDTDEQPGSARPDKIPQLKPAFKQGGTITAANASSISDGAAALVLMRQSEAEKRGVEILAVIRAQAMFAQEPAWFTTAPVGAMKKVLDLCRWRAEDVDLYEINEAFAVVAMAGMKELGIPRDRLNVHGGATALGHPLGASGARILVTLLSALQTYDKKTGVASLCIGGGEATAVAIERV